MAKPTFRERLRARGLTLWGMRFGGYYGYGTKRCADGDYVLARAADRAFTKLEREMVDLTSERDEARDEIVRLNAEIERHKRAKVHLICQLRGGK